MIEQFIIIIAKFFYLDLEKKGGGGCGIDIKEERKNIKNSYHPKYHHHHFLFVKN